MANVASVTSRSGGSPINFDIWIFDWPVFNDYLHTPWAKTLVDLPAAHPFLTKEHRAVQAGRSVVISFPTAGR